MDMKPPKIEIKEEPDDKDPELQAGLSVLEKMDESILMKEPKNELMDMKLLKIETKEESHWKGFNFECTPLICLSKFIFDEKHISHTM